MGANRKQLFRAVQVGCLRKLLGSVDSPSVFCLLVASHLYLGMACFSIRRGGMLMRLFLSQHAFIASFREFIGFPSVSVTILLVCRCDRIQDLEKKKGRKKKKKKRKREKEKKKKKKKKKKKS